ncbi:SSI family serine proteinase inhibitor [Streptomonospora wellingtoniae]|uniref:SSI family serine proteinase inhibitor n=1 Tax=Streptomonospora wellingtoniae TaxID=3075544 RepID=A0ABU2KXP1_9ACTN|nr:SSI family serine proteinase inhibitor [Streptomonospora sp. DSM 45055]MDT0303952.1 SSI family serine proteinase inhibitor [Streptomonospora sp. DSM 45055]
MRPPVTAAAPASAALLALVFAAGCGASEVRTPPEATPSGAATSPSGEQGPAPETELTIDISSGTSAEPSGAAGPSPVPSPSPAEPREWRLACGPAGGDHPAPEEACADLAEAGGAEAFEEVPENTPCTFIHGGPQVARITGHVGDTRIDTEVTRTDGCEMDRYDNLGAVLAP